MKIGGMRGRVTIAMLMIAQDGRDVAIDLITVKVAYRCVGPTIESCEVENVISMAFRDTNRTRVSEG